MTRKKTQVRVQEERPMSPAEIRQAKLAISQRFFANNQNAVPVHANVDSGVHSSHRRLSDGY